MKCAYYIVFQSGEEREHAQDLMRNIKHKTGKENGQNLLDALKVYNSELNSMRVKA